MEAYLIGYWIGIMIACVIMGCISKHINESKGYDGGFAWGFWLGVIGIIVVAVRADNRTNSYRRSEQDERMAALAKEEDEKRMLREGGWRCLCCQRVNASYVTTCVCGYHPTGAPKPKEIKAEPEKKKEPDYDEIKRLRALVDDGLITEEEFAAKKRQILGI